MRVHSDTTGKEYQAEDAVFYRNMIQSAWLLSKPGVTLLDVFTSNDGKLVMVFPKEQHRKWIGEWVSRKKFAEVRVDGK